MKKSINLKKIINSNKIVKWGGVLAILGGLTAGITIPAVNATKDADFEITKDIKGNSSIVDNITTNNLIDSQKKENSVKNNEYLTNAKTIGDKFLYEKEHQGSFMYQKQIFQWEIYNQIKKINNLKLEIIEKNSDANISTKDKEKFISDQKKEIKKAEDEKEKFSKRITNIDAKKIDWDSSNFAIDYPEILKPLSKIRSIQESIYNDAKANYIEGFTEKKDGEKNWPEKRRIDYSNAATDNEAIDYLVSQDIKAKANERFEFALDSNYSIEQLESGSYNLFLGEGFATIKNESNIEIYSRSYFFTKYWIGSQGNNLIAYDYANYNDKTVIPNGQTIAFSSEFFKKDTKFLVLDKTNPQSLKVTKVTDVDTWQTAKNNANRLVSLKKIGLKRPEIQLSEKNLLSNKIYFYSNNSKVSEIKILKNDNKKFSNSLFNKIAEEKLFNIQHALIAIIPDEKGSGLPWKIEKPESIKNLLKFLPGNSRVLKDYYANAFKSGEEEKTETYLKLWSDNSEGTKYKNGYLGLNSLKGHVKNFNEGFALGLIAAKNDKTNNYETNFFSGSSNSLFEKLNDAVKHEATYYKIGTENAGEYTIEDDKQLKQLLLKIEKEKLSNIFGAVFRDFFKKEGNKLYYKLDASRYVIVSKNGVHLIKINNEISSKQSVIDEIENDLKAIAKNDDINESKLISDGKFKIVNNIFVSDASRINYLFNSFPKTNKSENDNFKKYLLVEKIDKKIDNYSFETLEKIVETSLNSKLINEIQTISKPKIDWYINQIDGDFREIQNGLEPEKIYDFIFDNS